MGSFTSNKVYGHPVLRDREPISIENPKAVNGIKVCLSGLAISFIGALPFGTLNLTAFDISASQGIVPALWFAFAVVFVELCVVRLALFGSERIKVSHQLGNYLFPLAILFLWYLAYSSFTGPISNGETIAKAGILVQMPSPFVLGLLLSTVNPLQVPFWMTWNKVLESRGILQSSKRHYVFYLIGIGLGTITALTTFIIIGAYFFDRYNDYNAITNILIGTVYLGFSFYLLFLLIKKRLKTNNQ